MFLKCCMCGLEQAEKKNKECVECEEFLNDQQDAFEIQRDFEAAGGFFE